MNYGSAEHWAAMTEKIMAISVDKNRESYGSEEVPDKRDGAWRGGKHYYHLNCLSLENIPDDWTQTLRLRPVVRDSDAYWDAAPDWANWSVINSYGDEHWYEKEPNAGRSGWQAGARRRLASNGHPTDDWQNSKIQRPYAWKLPDDDTPVDTRCYAKIVQASPWRPWLYAEPGHCFPDGRMTFSLDGHFLCSCEQIVLADPNNPGRVPPTDLMLGLET